jgi:hypothetical protein
MSNFRIPVTVKKWLFGWNGFQLKRGRQMSAVVNCVVCLMFLVTGSASGEGWLSEQLNRIGRYFSGEDTGDRRQKKVLIPYPSRVQRIYKFFDESYTPGGYDYAYPEASRITICEETAKNGEVSLQFDLVASDYSGASVCLYNGTYDLRPLREKGALQFWIKGLKGKEQAFASLVDEAVSDDKKTVVRLRIDWYGCDSITQDWTLVTIPLKEYKNEGKYWSEIDSVEYDNEFDWGKVAEIRIEIKKDENNTFQVWLDDVFIVKPE